MAVQSDLRVVAHRQRLDPLVDVGHARRTPHTLHVGLFVHDADIAGDGVGKDRRLLHHHAAVAAPAAFAVLSERPAVE